MVKSGAFTLSLDCEGLWGMADQPGVVSGGTINQASLRQTYDFIYRTLSDHQIRCSAAFVTAFGAGPALLREQVGILRELARMVPFWYASVLPAMERGDYDGWDGHDFFRRFTDAGHEMAWHGTTHLPLEERTPDDAVRLELQLGASLLSALGSRPTSVVFPRNRIGHLAMLRRAGFETYRGNRGDGVLAKAMVLAREFNVFDHRVAEKPRRDGEWFVSPPGDFLNWPARVRAAVPLAVTVMRWKSLLRAAAEQGGYVHMWFHPHNFITAPAMKASFAVIIKEVAKWVRSGDMAVLTMDEANRYFASRSVGAVT